VTTRPAIAFFDFDGTLLRRDSRTLCALPGVKRGLISPALGLRIAASFVAAQLGVFSKERANAIAFECFRGAAPADIAHILDDIHANFMRPWLSPVVIARVSRHRAQGHRLAIATAGAAVFAAPAARDVGIAHVLGTELEQRGGVCTGLVSGPVLIGEHKLNRAREFAAEHGVDLADCSFYSDHIADLPLLSAVGTAVAVAPHRALRTEASRRGWEVLEHRGPGA
jgi:putative phosphoserine phosphatase/1-acylglycerol-3-phosphate O-acyltransferase